MERLVWLGLLLNPICSMRCGVYVSVHLCVSLAHMHTHTHTHTTLTRTQHARTHAHTHSRTHTHTHGGDIQVKLWDTGTGFCFVTFTEHVAPISSILFSTTDKVLVSASFDGTVRAYDRHRYVCIYYII